MTITITFDRSASLRIYNAATLPHSLTSLTLVIDSLLTTAGLAGLLRAAVLACVGTNRYLPLLGG